MIAVATRDGRMHRYPDGVSHRLDASGGWVEIRGEMHDEIGSLIAIFPVTEVLLLEFHDGGVEHDSHE
jgi:hypothetical protein